MVGYTTGYKYKKKKIRQMPKQTGPTNNAMPLKSNKIQ